MSPLGCFVHWVQPWLVVFFFPSPRHRGESPFLLIGTANFVPGCVLFHLFTLAYRLFAFPKQFMLFYIADLSISFLFSQIYASTAKSIGDFCFFFTFLRCFDKRRTEWQELCITEVHLLMNDYSFTVVCEVYYIASFSPANICHDDFISFQPYQHNYLCEPEL